MSSAALLKEIPVQFSNWVEAAVNAYDDQGVPNYLDKDGEILEGIYIGLPNDVYHALDALSSSAAKTFISSPAIYYRNYKSGVERKRTLALKRTFDAGTYGHEMCLEADGFYSRYFRDLVPSDVPEALHTVDSINQALIEAGLPAKEGKNEKKERLLKLVPSAVNEPIKTLADIDKILEDNGFNKSENKIDKAARLMAVKPDALVFDYIFAQNRSKHGEERSHTDEQGECFLTFGGKRPIDGVVWDDAHRVQRSLRNHAEGSMWITYGLPEVAIIARCPETGLLLKVKFDWLRFDDKAADVKTTLSAKPDDFRRQIYKLHYDIQEAFYTYVASLRGIYISEFAFVAVEYVNADICQPYTLSRRSKLKAKTKLHMALEEFKECIENDNWYGYQKEDCTIKLE